MTPNPRTISLLHILLLALSIPLALLACEQRADNNLADNPTPYPPPGEMRIVSVTTIPPQRLASDNLIVNGDIHQWWAGAPAPEGWHPPSRRNSSLTRQLNTNGTGFCVRQTWPISRRASGPASRRRPIGNSLYAETVDLEPNKRYRLSITSAIIAGEHVTIDIFESLEDSWKILHPDFIALLVNDGKVTQHTRDFTSGDGLRLAVSSKAEASDENVVTVDWYAWSIIELSEDADTTQGYSDTLIVPTPEIPQATTNNNDPKDAS